MYHQWFAGNRIELDDSVISDFGGVRLDYLRFGGWEIHKGVGARPAVEII